MAGPRFRKEFRYDISQTPFEHAQPLTVAEYQTTVLNKLITEMPSKYYGVELQVAN